MSTSRAAQVERSPTRILRDKGIDPSIKCTSTLVANYNAEEDAKVREAMRTWLDTLIEEFSKINPGSIPKSTVTEFMNLAEIKVREPADAELVRRVYTTIRRVVMGEKEGCSVYFVLALEYILSIIDIRVLQQDARTLVALADRLIEMTNPQKMPLTRDTFEYHGSCLHAFERVLMVLHDLEKERFANPIVKYFEEKTKKHLDMIISCHCYYPFAYQAILIKENIKTLLEKDTKTLLINAGRRAFYAFCGGLFIFQGVRELAVMKLDFNAMESGIGKFREAFRDLGWYSMTDIQEIVSVAFEAVEHDDFSIFQQCYDKHKKVLWSDRVKWSKHRMIRYALVSHLCLFCTEKHSRSNQNQAMGLLVQLATKKEGKQWREDQKIFEAIVEALIAIGKRNQEHQETIIIALETTIDSLNARQRGVVNGLLEGKTPHEIVKGACIRQEEDTGRTLFNSTRQTLDLERTYSMYERSQQTLKDHFRNDSFAKVSLLADENDQRHIGSFDFHLEEYEETATFREPRDQSFTENFNQQEYNLQRTMKVKKFLDMKHLFKTRRKHPNGPIEDVHRVLVIGNPGTGKTCLSKRICYDWAIGAWGSEFEHVYLVPIRRLNYIIFGTDVDLQVVIRQLVFNVSGLEDNKKSLYMEIKDNLSKATTLLIMDGYDEAGETAKAMVSSALKLGCRLLILSRPHSLHSIRINIEVEVECLEFQKEQLQSFISKEIESDEANDALEFISKNSSLEETCLIPINAQIMTRLWKSSYKEALVKSSSTNLTLFYSMLSKYAWTRFTEREERYDMNATFEALEHIAFESLRMGKVEIPRDLVIDLAPESVKVFCNSGFLLFMEEGTVFQFAHLTFHEYFAGCHLAKMLKSNVDKERKKAEKFISQHKYIGTSQVMLSFMVQQFCMQGDIKDNLEAFEDLLQVLEKDSITLVPLQHVLLKMRMLDAFLPCGYDESVAFQANGVVVPIVNEAKDVLKRWVRIEWGNNIKENLNMMPGCPYWSPIIDDLARMQNLFCMFPELLKTILLFENIHFGIKEERLRDIARIGRSNKAQAFECISPMRDSPNVQERVNWIKLCAFIEPVCVEPYLDYLKRLYEDQNARTKVANPMAVFLYLFPNNEDIRQLISIACRDQIHSVRCCFINEIAFLSFTQGSRVEAFVRDLMTKAMEDSDDGVKSIALTWVHQDCQTSDEARYKMIEALSKLVVSHYASDRKAALWAISKFIEITPEKSIELSDLLKALCKDDIESIQRRAVQSLLELANTCSWSMEDLFPLVSSAFISGSPIHQLLLLPHLFSLEKNENRGNEKTFEVISACQDLDSEVQQMAKSRTEALALLSKYDDEEIYNLFYDQDKGVQLELLRVYDMRERISSEIRDKVAKMAVHLLIDNHYDSPHQRLLNKLVDIELFPKSVLKELARRGAPKVYKLFGLLSGDRNAGGLVRRQPLFHLLQYYWETLDQNMILPIAEKILLCAVVCEKKGEKQMEIVVRENGTNIKQIATITAVQDLLEQCEVYLKKYYRCNFLSD